MEMEKVEKMEKVEWTVCITYQVTVGTDGGKLILLIHSNDHITFDLPSNLKHLEKEIAERQRVDQLMKYLLRIYTGKTIKLKIYYIMSNKEPADGPLITYTKGNRK